MKIKREKLIKILQSIYIGITSSSNKEETDKFIFYKNNLLVNTLDYQILTDIKKIKLPFQGSISSEIFYKTLCLYTSKYIKIFQKENKIKIKTKSSRASIFIQKIDKKNFTLINKNKIKWKSLPKNFLEGIQLCIQTGNISLSSSTLSLLYINKGYLEATDTFKVLKFKLDKNIKSDPFFISLKAATILTKYNVYKYSISNNKIHFKTKEDIIFSCYIYKEDMSFPDIDSVINFDGEKITLPNNLLSIINRNLLFCKSKINDKNLPINIKINNNKIILSSKNEIGIMKENIILNKNENKNVCINFDIMPEHILYILNVTNDFTFLYNKSKVKFLTDNFQLAIPIKSIDK